jgi:hypothetical protein
VASSGLPQAYVFDTGSDKKASRSRILAQLAIFIGSMGIMECRNSGQIREKFNDMYVPALFVNWKIWPVAQVSLAVVSLTSQTEFSA